MKKIHIIMLCEFIIITLVVGCSTAGQVNNNLTDNKINQDENNNNDETININNEINNINNETNNINSQDNNTNCNNNIENNNKDNNAYNNSYAIQVDRSLTGIELIKAAKIVHPIKTIAYDITSIVEGGDSGYQGNGTMLKDGKNYKIVTEASQAGQEGKIITIHNDSQKMTYQYYEATMTGYMYFDDQSEYGPSVDGDYDLTSLYAEETNLIEAKVIDYQGEPVIYFEILESGNHVDSWVSLKYGIMIKYQISYDEKVISSVTRSNITEPTGIDDSDFLPPSNVSFEDYSN